MLLSKGWQIRDCFVELLSRMGKHDPALQFSGTSSVQLHRKSQGLSLFMQVVARSESCWLISVPGGLTGIPTEDAQHLVYPAFYDLFSQIICIRWNISYHGSTALLQDLPGGPAGPLSPGCPFSPFGPGGPGRPVGPTGPGGPTCPGSPENIQKGN